MDRIEIVDSAASWSQETFLKGPKTKFLKKDAKISERRRSDKMHLQTLFLLSNDWGEVHFWIK